MPSKNKPKKKAKPNTTTMTGLVSLTKVVKKPAKGKKK
jgi:hypothetical protein